MGWSELAGAAIGALAFMATDSFWFNAVEAEVYAISMLFTALVVWLAFIWHDLQLKGQNGDRILLLVFYIIGLAIGVHLLNVLALPLVFLVVYFHWQEGRPFKFERFLLFWGLCTLSILPIYPGVVLWLPKLINALHGAGGEPLAVAGLAAILLGLAGLHVLGRRRGNRALALASAGLLLVIIGYLSYALILLRSGLNPPLDENDPQTLAGLIAYLSREQYGSESIVTQLLERKAAFWDYQIRHMYIRYFNWNFIGHDELTGAWTLRLWGLPLLLGLWGLATHVGRDWRRAFTVGNLFLLTGLAIVIYLNQEDPQPRERDYAYVGSFYAFAIWIGLGAWTLIEDLGRKAGRWRAAARAALALALLVLVPGRMAQANFFTHDRSRNVVAQDYARNALATLEPDAILFTNGDNDTFPLWYLQIVERFRTDVRVVNLSLLNTGWYVKQLRDAPPTVPIPPHFSDEMIATALDGHGDEAFAWRYWGPEVWTGEDGKPLPKALWHKVPMRSASGEVYAISVDPTMHIPMGDGNEERNFLRVQDRMILEIVKANAWRRPVYFAVTVARDNFVGLDLNLRMDGLAYRVMDRPIGENAVDAAVLEANLGILEQHLRGLADAGVYYDDNIQKLVQNYRSAFIQYALELEGRGERPKALAALTTMDKLLPEEVVPSFSPQLTMQLGLLFHRVGDSEGLRRRLVHLQKTPLGREDLFYLGSYYLNPLKETARGLRILDSLAEGDPSQEIRLQTALLLEDDKQFALAVERYRRVLLERPDQKDAMAGMIRVMERQGNWAEAIAQVQAWLKVHPEDPGALRRLARFQAALDSSRAVAAK
jgi:tetratricopeptide (TPR) repeat protein